MKIRVTLYSIILIILFIHNVSSFSFIKQTNVKPRKQNKEIGGSLLELISSPYDEIITNPNSKRNIFVSLKDNSTVPNTTTNTDIDTYTDKNREEIIHSAFPTPETSKMRKMGILTIIIFVTSFLIARLGYNFLKNISTFFSKGLYSLSNQIFLLFICYAILIVCYTYGAFDKILISWEYVIAGVGVVIISWIAYNTVLIFLALTVVSKWETLEKEATTYEDLKEKIQNNKSNSKSKDSSNLIDAMEYLTLKQFFFVPFYPVFKSITLRNDLDFSNYLSQCLRRKMRLFFKLSWTTLLSFIFIITIWNVYIIPSPILVKTILIMVVPLIGISISFGIYFYSKYIYHKVVRQINDGNISDYKDYKYDSNEVFQSLNYPQYLEKYIYNERAMHEERKAKWTFHEHLHLRPPSLYENLLIFGHSGLVFMLNTLQCCSFLFIIWSVATFGHFCFEISEQFTKFSYFFLIIGLLFFSILQAYSTILALKWLTVISSIEMKRDDKSIIKMINNQLKKDGEIANDIFNCFKLIYYDAKEKNANNQLILIEENEDESEFSLKYASLKDIIKNGFERFKKRKENVIDVKHELRPFLKTCGNKLTDKEIDFLLRLGGSKFDNLEELSLNQLQNLCGAITHFREERPFKIVHFVFDNYYKENPQVYKDNVLRWENIEVFMQTYDNYFNKKHIAFVKRECDYIGNSFTLDAFISMIFTPRYYYPS